MYVADVDCFFDSDLDLQMHEDNHCCLRSVPCTLCHAKVIANEMRQHLDVFKLFPVECSNGCGLKRPRNEMTNHTDTCSHSATENAAAECDFYDVKQEQDCCRSHEDSTVHYEALKKRIKSLENENTQKSQILQGMERRINRMENTTTDGG